MFSLIFFSLISAASNLEVTCWDGSCLKYGWSVTGPAVTDYVENKCREESCETIGWYGGRFQGEQFYTRCMDDSCFKSGYWVLRNYTHEKLSTVVCNGPEKETDCLRYGWTDYLSGRSGYQVSCIKNDCRKYGWYYNHPLFGYRQVTCKNLNCFTDGWYEN